MTGPEHYQEAEKCIGWARTEADRDKRTSLHARAQVHAMLALTAATATSRLEWYAPADRQQWVTAASADPSPRAGEARDE